MGAPMTDNSQGGQELQDGPEEPKAILVAVDTSSQAEKVVSAAARLSRGAPMATLHVAHVFRSSGLTRGGSPPLSNADVIEDAKEHLAYHVSQAKRQSRASVVGHFVVGDPTLEILKLCSDLHADALVVGTHDHVGFERLLLGSIAETLVRKAPCSVMVVRTSEHSR
jgi:nucleotide-binding universal stress UspA family protein